MIRSCKTKWSTRKIDCSFLTVGFSKGNRILVALDCLNVQKVFVGQLFIDNFQNIFIDDWERWLFSCLTHYLLCSVLLYKFTVAMPLASSPLANVHVSVGVLVHAFPIVRRRCVLRGLLRINRRVFFVGKLITAVATHPPVAKPTLATTTTKATGTTFAAPTEVTLTNHTHARPHVERPRIFRAPLPKLRDFKRRHDVHQWELSKRSRISSGKRAFT